MAPSPTGEYHIGGMRTLLYNYAYAKKEGGKFILRIEDTDRERLVPGATERLIQVIKDYGLGWDEGPGVGGPYAPYVQSERLAIYKKYADQLVESGHAYYCFCTKERLEKLREDQQAQKLSSTKYDKHCLKLSSDEVKAKLSSGTSYVIRLNVPADEEVSFEDKVLGKITFPTNDIDDQVLLKSDGFPTYHLAVVVDDHLMNITLVMRGFEWLPSTSKHILLYKALGWEFPAHGHIPLLKELGATKKLSKRMGSVAAVEFLSDGYLPEALLNFLMFLGWNPGTEKEIYTLEEFIHDFSIEKIHKTDLVVFDRDKLSWFNGYYIRNKSDTELYAALKEWAQKYSIELNGADKNDEYNLSVLKLVKDRMRTLKDFNELTSYFYNYSGFDKDTAVKFAESEAKLKAILQNFVKVYEGVQTVDWTSQSLDKLSHAVLETYGYNTKEAFMTLRVVVTGQTATPPLFDIMEVIGKEATLARLRKF